MVSAAVGSDVVWEIDRAASHGEVSTRHWFWGRQAGSLEPVDGRMVRRGNEWTGLSVVVRSAARDGASVMVEFHAAGFRPDDYGRFTVAGEFRIDGVACDVELRLHDLGTSAATNAPARRFATIAGDMVFPSGARRIWSRAVTGPHLTVFAHTEWVTRTDAVSP